MSTEPVEIPILETPLTDPEIIPVDPAPAVEPEPDPATLLEVECACKICRGRGENYTFKNDQPYLNHLKQDHPECFQPAYE